MDIVSLNLLMSIIVLHFQPREIKFSLFVKFIHSDNILPNIFSFPFNWKSPFGYIVAVSLQAFGMYFISMISFCAILFIISQCEFSITFSLDIEEQFRMLNKSIEFQSEKKKKKEKPPMGLNIEIEKQLCEIIRFECDIKQLSV